MSRIRQSDIELVREKARIDDVVRDFVTLKVAGGGSLKGLCPFHDERSPSFHVTPARGFFHCFGCQESGDVFTFLKKIEGLSFVEAIEKLAAKYNITLVYEDGPATSDKTAGVRTRLVEAHRAAAAYFVTQLGSAEAETARNFLINRGFNSEAAGTFGIGYAPRGWDNLQKHLHALGFKDEELLAGGLLSQGNRGAYDRFRGRLIWPIRDLSADVIGFGARKLYDDDDGPKYLNTPETPIYKKSQVLYGIDLARRDIAKLQSAVIVEGYTDVMACHLSGITTAVATCGTAFGGDHIKVLRRLLLDHEQSRGEVIFTFDGDAAGRKAALKAFDDDQKFASHTFVAVEPEGKDPCDLWQTRGPEAVRHLISNKTPMFEFAIKSALADVNLNTAEGRVAGLRAAAPIVASIRDQALRPEYTRLLAGWLGLEQRNVAEAVMKAPRITAKTQTVIAPAAASVDAEPNGHESVQVIAPVQRPDFRRLEHRVEKEALKAVVQHPDLAFEWYMTVEDAAFTFEPFRELHQVVLSALMQVDPSEIAATAWTSALMQAAPSDSVRTALSAVLVEPMSVRGEMTLENYVTGLIAKLLELDATRRINDLKGQLQRIDAGIEPASDEIFTSLLALENHRRTFFDHARGIS